MKRLLFTLTLGILSVTAYSQDFSPRNSLRIGLNRAFFGAGDITGPALYVEYSRVLTPYLAVTPRIMSGYGNTNNDYFIDHASDFGTSVALRFTPFPNSGFRRIKFDIGGLYHRFISSFGSVVRQNKYEGWVTEDSFYRKEDLFGFIGSVNVNILDNSRFGSGVRLDLLTSLEEGYLNADSFQVGAFFGIRF